MKIIKRMHTAIIENSKLIVVVYLLLGYDYLFLYEGTSVYNSKIQTVHVLFNFTSMTYILSTVHFKFKNPLVLDVINDSYLLGLLFCNMILTILGVYGAGQVITYIFLIAQLVPASKIFIDIVISLNLLITSKQIK